VTVSVNVVVAVTGGTVEDVAVTVTVPVAGGITAFFELPPQPLNTPMPIMLIAAF
jgi:hypothetical protein